MSEFGVPCLHGLNQSQVGDEEVCIDNEERGESHGRTSNHLIISMTMLGVTDCHLLSWRVEDLVCVAFGKEVDYKIGQILKYKNHTPAPKTGAGLQFRVVIRIATYCSLILTKADPPSRG